MPKLGLGGFIRGMQEARSALAEVLAQQERRLQIILIMQKIVVCMSRDTRKFLSDAMAGLIEGGLDYMRQKRREAIEALQKKAAPVAAPVAKAPEPPARQMESDRIRERIRQEMLRKQEEQKEKDRERRDAEERMRLEQEERERLEAARAAPEPEPVEVIPEPVEESPEFELPSPEDFGAAPVEAPPVATPEPVAKPVARRVEPPLPAPVVPEPAPEPEPAPAPEPVAAEVEEIKAIEELGTELDALSLADVAREVFPELKKDYEPWQVARTIYIDEASMRKAVLQGARLKDNDRATMLAPAFDDVKRLIEVHKPSWIRSIPAIREVIDAHFAAEPPKPGLATAPQVCDVIVMSDQKAMSLLKLIVKTNDPGIPYVAQVRARLDRLLEIEAERT